MFRVVRVWDDGDSTTFRYTKPKFDTMLAADIHRHQLQNRFPKYVFWISEGDVRSLNVKLTKHQDAEDAEDLRSRHAIREWEIEQGVK